MLVAHLPEHPHVAGVIKPHATGTLGDGFADDGSDLVAVPLSHLAHLGFPTGVDAWACRRAGSEELLWQHVGKKVVHAADGVAHRHCSESVPVVAARKRQEAGLFGMAGISLVLDGGLESHFDRDRSRIGKKDAFEALRGHRDQALRQVRSPERG